jgi:EAL domain-containing protein (putative c-di-GMP-specific phosphodiesterase class I)
VGLERNEFALHYQPSIRLSDGAIAGFEVLLRWNHPVHGLVAPLEFISLAEESGQISKLGRWVLEQACRQLRAWQQAFPTDPARTMSVNVSARQLLEPTFPDVVRAAVESAGIEPLSLTLEITESVAMDDSEATLQRLNELKDLGVRLAIDDFGTGYSSLTYLRHLPVDILKVDKAFVDGIADGGEALELTRVIVQMGQTLRLSTVAEGVELPTQAALLRTMSCEMAQGYHFARPATPEAISELLKSSADRFKAAG